MSFNQINDINKHTVASQPSSGVARVQRLPGHLVGVATCDHKVNFEPGFETVYM